jgi:hypothetical protein
MTNRKSVKQLVVAILASIFGLACVVYFAVEDYMTYNSCTVHNSLTTDLIGFVGIIIVLYLVSTWNHDSKTKQ